MTTTVTVIDSSFDANDSVGRKSIFASLSLTNPYSTDGDAVTVSSWFKTKPLGATIVGINPSVSILAAGILATGTFRYDNSSTTTIVLQLFNGGLAGNFGRFVDTTVTALTAATCFANFIGY